MANGLLKSEQIAEIEQKVNAILEEHVTFNQWEILQKTASKEGIVVEVAADLKDISGVLFKDEQGGWKILLNKEDSLTRKLFTFAHELGHYFLHKDKNSKFIDSQFGTVCYNRIEETKYQDLELEANEFAGILIMPQSIVDKEIGILKKKLGTDTIDSKFIAILANHFKVSPIAMLTRLKNLGYVT